jgi:hypothetical protein
MADGQARHDDNTSRDILEDSFDDARGWLLFVIEARELADIGVKSTPRGRLEIHEIHIIEPGAASAPQRPLIEPYRSRDALTAICVGIGICVRVRIAVTIPIPIAISVSVTIAIGVTVSIGISVSITVPILRRRQPRIDQGAADGGPQTQNDHDPMARSCSMKHGAIIP